MKTECLVGKDSNSQDSLFSRYRKKAKVSKRYQRWNLKENDEYVKFLIRHEKMFEDSLERRSSAIYNKMACELKNGRNNHQCRSHHMKMLKKYRSIRGIIEKLHTDHALLEEKKLSKTRSKEDIQSNLLSSHSADPIYHLNSPKPIEEKEQHMSKEAEDQASLKKEQPQFPKALCEKKNEQAKEGEEKSCYVTKQTETEQNMGQAKLQISKQIQEDEALPEWFNRASSAFSLFQKQTDRANTFNIDEREKKCQGVEKREVLFESCG